YGTEDPARERTAVVLRSDLSRKICFRKQGIRRSSPGAWRLGAKLAKEAFQNLLRGGHGISGTTLSEPELGVARCLVRERTARLSGLCGLWRARLAIAHGTTLPERTVP